MPVKSDKADEFPYRDWWIIIKILIYKMNYEIRNAERGDIDEIIKLCAEHAEFERADFSPLEKVEKLAKSLFSDNPPIFCLVVANENGLLGYSSFMPLFSTWDADYYVYMDCLFLRPEARNFGIGEQLLKEIANFAKLHNIRQIQWQTPDFNDRAIKFYHRIGAASKDKTRFYLDQKVIAELTK